MARRAANQPSGLSRERILEVALGLASTEGIEALSMRRLAHELDVWPMSVYRYFQDKDALLDAMAAQVIDAVPAPDPAGTWRERLHALLDDARAAMIASPVVAERLPRAFVSEGAFRLPEAGIAILLEAGLDPPAAAAAWRTLWSYTFGFASFAADSARVARAAIAGLPEDEYPALAGAGDDLAAVLADDAHFASGLDTLLDGLRVPGGV
jgi:TetR/AcrR family tetracycline transcriptional repressor